MGEQAAGDLEDQDPARQQQGAEEAPARYRATKNEPESRFRIGQNVVHPKFGQGVIVRAEGFGADARLQINFGAQGMKWLQLDYAKLEPA